MQSPPSAIDAIFDEHETVLRASRKALSGPIVELAEELAEAFRSGGKLLVFGNGGSAADAQHLAAEFVGRFKRTRPGLAAIALTTDASVLTGIANDWDYGLVFARQVEALAGDGDLVVGISTSGAAENVVRGLAAARQVGARTWALSGATGGPVAAAADRRVLVPSSVTARIQELHIVVIHAVSELVEDLLAAAASSHED